MNKEELFEEIEDTQGIAERYFGLSLGRFFTLTFIVLIIGVYIGVLFYGTNSIEILFGLEEYQNYLDTEISKLKNENAELQKEYFELKEISAQ